MELQLTSTECSLRASFGRFLLLVQSALRT